MWLKFAYKIPLLLLPILFLLNHSIQAAGVSPEQLDVNIISKYRYNHIDKSLPEQMRGTLEREESTVLNISLSGFISNWQYQIVDKIDFNKGDNILEQLSFSNFVGRGVIELGKKDWSWGEGFINNPTYPLDKEEHYWGVDYSRIIGDKNLNFGGIIDDGTGGDTLWLRWGGLTIDSNYTFVGTYNNENLKIGINYSRDLTKRLSGYTACSFNTGIGNEYSYLVGGKYFYNDLMFITEYTDQLMLFSVNNSDIFSDYSWNFSSIYNTDDKSRRDSLSLSFSSSERYQPGINIFRNTGDKGTTYSSFPMNWGIELSLKVLLH